jgi:hypothetical protein
MKEGRYMSKDNNDKQKIPVGNSKQDMDGGPITGSLNSDNSFSENGLENDRLLREAAKEGNSTII